MFYLSVFDLSSSARVLLLLDRFLHVDIIVLFWSRSTDCCTVCCFMKITVSFSSVIFKIRFVTLCLTGRCFCEGSAWEVASLLYDPKMRLARLGSIDLRDSLISAVLVSNDVWVMMRYEVDFDGWSLLWVCSWLSVVFVWVICCFMVLV